MVKLSGRLFALWLLLIPLLVSLPVFELDYAPYFFEFSNFSLYPNQLIALFFTVSAMVWFRSNLDLAPLILTIPLILLCLLTLLGLWTAQVDGRLTAVQLGRILIALTLFFILKTIPFNRSHLFQAILLFLAVQGIAATLQYGLQDDLGLRFLGEYDVEPLPGRGSIIFGPSETYWLRSYGLTPHPNILGGFAGSALCATVFWWDSERSRTPVWFTTTALFLGALAVLFSFSRSAWLGTGLGIGFGFALSLLTHWHETSLFPVKQGQSATISAPARLANRHRDYTFKLQPPTHLLFILTPLFLALVVFWLMVSDAFQARSQPLPSQTVTQSVGERQLLKELAYTFIETHRLSGIGANNFGPAMLDLPNQDQFPSIHPVHHVPLLLTAELGYLGGAIWLFLMLLPPVLAFLFVWRGAFQPMIVGCAAALVVLAVVDLFDYYSWGWPHGLTWRWMWFALMTLSIKEHGPIGESLHT